MIITVNLKDHSYPINVQRNSLKQSGVWVKSIWAKQKVALVTDNTVNQIYAQQVKESLDSNGFQTTVMVIPSGETSKSLEMTDFLYRKLAQNHFTKNDGVIALGGGVVGDLAGFVAATYMRGIHFLQFPTSLLAQVDSSIGGKTAINMTAAKNLIGTFYQPDGVLIDPAVLDTLPQRRLREGVAEIVKAAAIADVDLWQLLEGIRNSTELKQRAEEIIIPALKVKQQVVEKDEFDQNQRLILNFGHTIGHAIEKTAGYGTISHGESVAIGMIKITQQAEKMGLTPKYTTQKLQHMLSKFDLPTTLTDFNPRQIKETINHDKKVREGQLNIILLEKIGQAKIVPIYIDTIEDYLQSS